MTGQAIDSIVITERVNGWWVTVRFQAGNEEHHGPYDDETSAQREADLVASEPESDNHPSLS